MLAKGYVVHGLIRRSSSFNTSRINHIYTDVHDPSTRLFLHFGDLTDGSRLATLLEQIQPDEIYNLAAQSHVRVSFDEPEYTSDTTGLGTMRLLEAFRHAVPDARFYQASSSEMFGSTHPPQDESSPFHPRSPYGVAKLFSHWATRNYREAYGLYTSCGILFNHESPRRGETFVTRKITRAVARITRGEQSELFLGNLDARRDWGYAPEYVVAMWKMLQQESPDDYVVGTGTDFSVRDFVQLSFAHVGLDWKKYVRFDDRYLRPSEVESLVADSRKSQEVLGWQPTVTPATLAALMVDHDIRILDRFVADVPKGPLWEAAISAR